MLDWLINWYLCSSLNNLERIQQVLNIFLNFLYVLFRKMFYIGYLDYNEINFKILYKCVCRRGF